jgi:hypothetical protein
VLDRPLSNLFGEEVTSLLRHGVLARRANPAGTALDAGTAVGSVRLLANVSRSGAICIDLLRGTPPACGAITLRARRQARPPWRSHVRFRVSGAGPRSWTRHGDSRPDPI